MLIVLSRNQPHLGMLFLWSTPLKECCFPILFRWSEKYSKNIPCFHGTHSGVSKGCGHEQIWNTLTTHFLLQAVAFLSSLQEEATSVFLVLCHLYLWKEIWSSQWLLQSWFGGNSWPLNATVVLLSWNSPFQIYPFHLMLMMFYWRSQLILSLTRCFCLPYTWLPSFSSPFTGVLVSSVHMTRIDPGSWPVLMCTVVFASWVIELPQLPLVNLFFYLTLVG